VARCDVPRRECFHDHIYGHLRDPKPSGTDADSARALCPAHADTERSLSVSVGEHQRVVYHCFGHCDELAVRAALIGDGVHEDCLPISKAREAELLDQVKALYAKGYGHAELRWRMWSLVSGFNGEMPPRRGYPGGRRGFASDAGVGHSDFYGSRPVR
jgi:hypothetical protein